MFETRKMVEMEGWEQRRRREKPISACSVVLGGQSQRSEKGWRSWDAGKNGHSMTLTPGRAGGRAGRLAGWQARMPQLWLGSISCLFARGVINNHLPATGSTEASQGTAWCCGQSPAWWPGELDSGISVATCFEPCPAISSLPLWEC